MSILNVNTIQPVGSAQTVTVSATDLKICSTTLSSGGSGVFVGNLTGNVTGNLTGNINSTGVSTVTTLRVSSNTISIPTGHKIVGTDIGSVYAPGTIIQVQSIIKTYPFLTNSTSHVVVTGLSVSITPLFSSSKILITTSVNGNCLNRGGLIELRRDGSRVNDLMPASYGSRGPTNIGGLWTGDGSGDTGMLFGSTTTLYDSPNTTSSVTYAVYAKTLDPGSVGTRINYTAYDDDGADFIRGVSTLTVMEVKQ